MTIKSRLLKIELRKRGSFMRHKDPELMKRIQDYLSEYYLENAGAMPSTTQIAAAVGVVRSTAYNYLVAMDKKGMIRYKDGEITSARLDKIMVDREPADALGSIACGEPMLEEPDLLYRTSLPTAIFGKGPFYILRARGDSMEDAGIEEGDLLVIRKNEIAKKGDIVVALDNENQNTLKLFDGYDKKTKKAILRYQNRAVYGDKVILVKDLVCQGVLSHVIKER